MPKIAICDDEQPIREYLKSLTEKCIPDSQVRLFGSGEALLRDQTSFDVILLDVSLRGEDGNQTCEDCGFLLRRGPRGQADLRSAG